MKKLMIAAALCAAGVCYGVESSNIVGYQTATVGAKTSIGLAIQFDAVTGASLSFDVDKVVTGFTPKSSGRWGNAMDQMWIYDNENDEWKLYGYYKPTGGSASWQRYDSVNDEFSALTSSDVVTSGETILYYNGQSSKDVELQFSGAVKQFTATRDVTIDAKTSKYAAYPWPVQISVSDITTKYLRNEAKSSGRWGNAMDQIWVYDNENDEWALYGYYKPTGGSASWQRYDMANDEFTAITSSDVVPAGNGFLYYNGQSKSDQEIHFYFGDTDPGTL